QLLISGKNISRISELAGFENTSYFTQEFRRQTGMTPSEFIKKYKKTRHLD
ncbi:MAG: AraC family transcriptional regulator, partial [Oscillospiraceae bacterium]|nr:AraC family transcriptional regulator [Oscillospiraceae bacterium]